jgi:hypothetical protein
MDFRSHYNFFLNSASVKEVRLESASCSSSVPFLFSSLKILYDWLLRREEGVTRPSVRTFQDQLQPALEQEDTKIDEDSDKLIDLSISTFVSVLSRCTNRTFSFRYSNVFWLFCFRSPSLTLWLIVPRGWNKESCTKPRCALNCN